MPTIVHVRYVGSQSNVHVGQSSFWLLNFAAIALSMNLINIIKFSAQKPNNFLVLSIFSLCIELK